MLRDKLEDYNILDAAAVLDTGNAGRLMGAFKNMPMEVYHGFKNYVSSGVVRAAEISPRHAYDKMTAPFVAGTGYIFGTLLHSAVLDLEEFKRTYMPTDIRRGTIAYKDLEAKNPGMTVIKSDEYERVINTAHNMLTNDTIAALMQNGESEISLFWQDEDTGVLCRARPDRLDDDLTACLDLKSSSKGIDPQSFARIVHNCGYHIQQALYRRGIKAVFDADVINVLIAIESKSPYDCIPYSFDDDPVYSVNPIDIGNDIVCRQLKRLAKCLETNEWPGQYPIEGLAPLHFNDYINRTLT